MDASSEPRSKIAIVEDNPDNLLLMRALLEKQFDLATYTSAGEALEGMTRDLPDLAVVDISLPEMDGTELLDRMRKNPDLSAVPVVAVTAHAMDGDKEEYLRMGFDGYLAKPIKDERVLLDTLKLLLRRRGR